MTATVLVVDDADDVRAIIRTELRRLELSVVEAVDGRAGWQRFRDERPDLVITDLRMPRADGIQLLRRIRAVSDTPVLLLTAYADVPTAVAAVKGGANDFLRYPDDVERLPGLVKGLLDGRSAGIEPKLEKLIVGKSPAMQQVRRRVAGVAPLADVPVLVCGESGVGLDHIVEVLHGLSAQAGASLVRLDCTNSKGLRIPSNAEAIYFDELSKLPLDQQRFLLASIQEGALVDAKTYASVSTDPTAAVAAGTLDPGLANHFQRFAIRIPPLRERATDIPLLVTSLCERLGESLGRTGAHVSTAAMARLKQYSWPGNVRELAGVLEQLIAFSADGAISKRNVTDALGEVAVSVGTARQQRDREQREELILLLDETGGNLAEIGRRLDIRPSTVAYRAKKFGLFI